MSGKLALRAPLVAENLVKVYPGADRVAAVRGASLSIEAGELVLLMGPSGSGKTTLLSLLGCILVPDEGRLTICGEEVRWDESVLPRYRRRYFGFIYQNYNLLASLNARENVEVPLLLSGKRGGESRRLVEQALDTVKLSHRREFWVTDLSGGEKQRVAIARAIAADAPILLADEPTGNLDSDTGKQIMTVLRSLAKDRGRAVLIVTHDERHIPFADRVFRMEDGMIRVT